MILGYHCSFCKTSETLNRVKVTFFSMTRGWCKSGPLMSARQCWTCLNPDGLGSDSVLLAETMINDLIASSTSLSDLQEKDDEKRKLGITAWNRKTMKWHFCHRYQYSWGPVRGIFCGDHFWICDVGWTIMHAQGKNYSSWSANLKVFALRIPDWRLALCCRDMMIHHL